MSRYLVVWDSFGVAASSELDIPDGEDLAEGAARLVAEKECVKSIDYIVQLPDGEDGTTRRANDLLCDLKGRERPDYEHCVICRHQGWRRRGFPLCEYHAAPAPELPKGASWNCTCVAQGRTDRGDVERCKKCSGGGL